MKELPEADIYVDGLDFWPYKKSLATVLDHVITHAPVSATALDVMCGPGYLLGKIKSKRTDLILSGLDIDPRYISYGRVHHPFVNFHAGNVLQWRPEVRQNVVMCTGSIHHVPYEQQGDVIESIASMLVPGGFAVISDCYVDDYSTDRERLFAAARLGYEYLAETIRNGAPDQVLRWTTDILYNDLFMYEFKSSFAKRLPLMQKHFRKVETIKTWPVIESGYGDYIHICHN